MNLFALHDSPILAAQYQCDKHVVKMTLETAQLLCTVGATVHGIPDAPYKPTHLKHPVTLWVGETMANWWWTVIHMEALLHEYTHRYNKIHASEKVLVWELAANQVLDFPEYHTPFCQCMPEQYRGPDAVEAYRRYYREEKAGFAKWTKREPPEWWEET